MIEYPIVRIFTFKEGLLSRFAHDLQLAVTRFEIELAGDELTGRFEADSLVVEGVVRDGKLEPRVLSSSDCAKILATAKREVLQTARYPEVRLQASLHTKDEDVHLEGTLTLMGRRLALPRIRPVHVTTAWIADFHLVPSRWGIKPYRAMGGTLKLQDRIRVEVALPAGEDWDHRGARRTWSMSARGGAQIG